MNAGNRFLRQKIGSASIATQRRLSRLINPTSVTAAVLAALYGAPSVADEERLEEIIVTATRHSVSAQDVPLSLTAVAGAALEQAGITDVAGLARSVAGVAYSDKGPFAGVNGATLVIRGLNGQPTAQLALGSTIIPPVATYVDETPVFVNLRLFDLDRVEILRGPQGTLYGSGSLGGTIRFVQNAPDPAAFDAKVRTGFGDTVHAKGTNYDTDAMLNLPVSDTFAVRLNAGYSHEAGFIDQPNLYQLDSSGVPVPANPADLLSPPVTYRKDGVNSYDYESARIAALWKPSDAFRAQLSYYHQLSTADGYPYASPVAYGLSALDSSDLDLETTRDSADVAALTLDYDLGFATMTSATSWSQHNNATHAEFTALYQTFSFYTAYYGGNPRAFFVGNDRFDDKGWSQEIRLTSKTGTRFDWVAGLFYRDQKTSIVEHEFYPGYGDYFDACLPVYGFGSPECGFGEWPYPNNEVDGITVEKDMVYVGDVQTHFKDMAVFGELTWNISSAWSLTAGARAFKQKLAQDQQTGVLFAGPTFVAVASRAGDLSRTLFKLNTAYKFDADNLVYGMWSQGFRHGVVNALPPSTPFGGATDPRLFTVPPDTADNYELGIKGTIRNRFLYSAALYDVEWKHIQASTLLTALGFPGAIDLGDGYSRGLELEISGKVSERLAVQLGYTYDKTKLTAVSDVAATNQQHPPAVGGQLPGTPEHSLALSLDYGDFAFAGGELRFRLSGHYQSEVVPRISTTIPNAPGYTTLDARATLTQAAWQVSLYVDNLTDELAITSYTDPAIYGSRYSALVSRPRTIGFSVSYSFKER
jgi:outer membrane receptor protein involved in Fe transport